MTLIPDLQRDLVDAAGRLGEPRLPPWGRLAAGLMTVAAIAALVLAVTTRSDDPSSPRESAAPPELPPDPSAPPGAPRPDVHPIPGSGSDPLEFEFGGAAIPWSGSGARTRYARR